MTEFVEFESTFDNPIAELLEKTKQFKAKVLAGDEGNFDFANDCSEELESIFEELLKTEWRENIVGAMDVLREAFSIPDPEDPSTMIYQLGSAFADCMQEIVSPLHIAYYLLDKGESEDKKIIVNGLEMTLRNMMEFFDLIAYKNISIGESFIKTGEINDLKVNIYFDPFKDLGTDPNKGVSLLQQAINLEKKCKQQIIDGNTDTQRPYIAFGMIASKLVEQQYRRIDIEEDIEVMKVLARIPDPAAVCGEYYDRLDFFKKYPDGDFYIHMNSEVFMTLLKTVATPLNILELERHNEKSSLDLESLKIYNPLLETNPDSDEIMNYMREKESAEIQFSTKYLRSFISLEG
ncbi:hypothetical protein SOX05_08975 [Pseudomonas putida]|nr:hypothetical protein [Pseudomonas putida]MDY4319395.1 hypothetical protein [Pseudomonas putida]MDY4352780.1 hypothetical protein [Pseudomonas putida]